MKCTYSHPGTWGDECGAIARWAAPIKSENTESGVYWARRCDKCRQWAGPDNADIGQNAWVPIDPAKHTNQFKRYGAYA